MNTRLWLDVAQSSEHSGHHPVTLRRALQSGELHGTQRKAKGKWRIHVTCLDAWLLGQPCDHQGGRAKAS
ncbi:MAG: helix-turn-helix domain-containing protein [Actinomycetota bacterium]|nr:helix-turn-helix domain-containing protein [Actinomycetota bacterium]